MRDTIVVEASELYELIKELQQTEAEYIEITIDEPFNDDDEIYPAALRLCAYTPECSIEFEPIEAPENEDEILDNMRNSVSVTPNLISSDK